ESPENDSLVLPDLASVTEADRLIGEPDLAQSMVLQQAGDALTSSLTKLGLVPSRDLERARRRLGGDQATSAELAREPLGQGKVTAFQMRQLARGQGKALVLGNYILLDRLGAGGMGEVFKARHARMKRVVALKLLPERLVESRPAVERFHREVEAAAQLVH